MTGLDDPDLATVFNSLYRTGAFSLRYLYRTLYNMSEAEADHAYQLLKDEKVDLEGNLILHLSNLRAKELNGQKEKDNG